ncbi:hypothetical protein BHL82_07665 [Limosilactobacillus reuteri]|uniref:Gram-positive cocci surface proteins LPxTG domain-containing protein n=3 Tax=Limosilactobacillus reuteri TaxID=1598 RepID=A0A1Y2UMK7_LIMRT|nr:hypothetical protein BHL82_07665 [Limosilactobacillus reuteri]
MSDSVSVSNSGSTSLSESPVNPKPDNPSESISMSEQISTSLSVSTSISTSILDSMNASTSTSLSDSISTTISNSSSINSSHSIGTIFPENNESANGSGDIFTSVSLDVNNSTNNSGLENTDASVTNNRMVVELTEKNSVENSDSNGKNNKLPQTGTTSQITTGLLGLGLLSLEAILLLIAKKNKNSQNK